VKVFHDVGIQVNGSFVFGFDEDYPDVFDRTVEWIERHRLACATFHILTPYPGTPLFVQMKKEKRLIHQKWDLYDTAHCVFKPKHMPPEELESGYARCYKELFSLRSIWKRRPDYRQQIPGYLAMSFLYKKTNFLWPFIIRQKMTHSLWRPMIQIARNRHLRFRQRYIHNLSVPTLSPPVPPGV
jgi:radical SAM superfamily enzyme YgiQ (UPF0313 family)